MNQSKADDLARRCVEKMLGGDPCSRNFGIALIDVGAGWAEMRMAVTEEMCNGHRMCHGGVIFTLGDSTFACTCNGYDRITVALGCEIEFLASAYVGDVLTAQGRERKRGRTTGVYDIEIFNQEKKLVALFRGKAFITDKKIIADQ